MEIKYFRVFLTLLIVTASHRLAAHEASLIYFKDVAPIFEKRCSGCHSSNSTGSINWSDYKTVFEMKEQIYLKVVSLKSMPLYSKMPQEERNLIKLWIEQGAQE